MLISATIEHRTDFLAETRVKISYIDKHPPFGISDRFFTCSHDLITGQITVFHEGRTARTQLEPSETDDDICTDACLAVLHFPGAALALEGE